jgi:hypothetical protein
MRSPRHRLPTWHTPSGGSDRPAPWIPGASRMTSQRLRIRGRREPSGAPRRGVPGIGRRTSPPRSLALGPPARMTILLLLADVSAQRNARRGGRAGRPRAGAKSHSELVRAYTRRRSWMASQRATPLLSERRNLDGSRFARCGRRCSVAAGASRRLRCGSLQQRPMRRPRFGAEHSREHRLRHQARRPPYLLLRGRSERAGDDGQVHAGPLFPTTCTTGSARITFVLEPWGTASRERTVVRFGVIESRARPLRARARGARLRAHLHPPRAGRG